MSDTADVPARYDNDALYFQGRGHGERDGHDSRLAVAVQGPQAPSHDGCSFRPGGEAQPDYAHGYHDGFGRGYKTAADTLESVRVGIDAFCSADDGEAHPWYGCEHHPAKITLLDIWRLVPAVITEGIETVTAFFDLDTPLWAFKAWVDASPDGYVEWHPHKDEHDNFLWAVTWSCQ